MPIESANIDFSKSNKDEKSEKTESELRKEAMNQIFKDGRKVFSISSKILFIFFFIYGFISLLQDVNML